MRAIFRESEPRARRRREPALLHNPVSDLGLADMSDLVRQNSIRRSVADVLFEVPPRVRVSAPPSPPAPPPPAAFLHTRLPHEASLGRLTGPHAGRRIGRADNGTGPARPESGRLPSRELLRAGC